jgi:hypothetical protein
MGEPGVMPGFFCKPDGAGRPAPNYRRMSMQRLIAAVALGSAILAVPTGAQAGEAVVVWSRQSCEMALIEKPPGGHFGVILRLTENRLEIGDKLEGDFESIDAIRQMKNLESGEDIMMRGVRYSTSRKYVLQVMPKWCKAPKE